MCLGFKDSSLWGSFVGEIAIELKYIFMLTMSKIYNHHYEYTVFEARAITALRTCNIIFKNWCPWEFLKKNSGTKCMYPPCPEKDSLLHVMECKFYRTKFEQVEGVTRDWANYLTRLNQERVSEFNQPLISCRGWSTVKTSEAYTEHGKVRNDEG